MYLYVRIILALRKLECCNCNCIFYVDFICLAANKSILRIYDGICITLCAIYDKTNGTAHMGDTFLILTDLDQLTNYSSMK